MPDDGPAEERRPELLITLCRGTVIPIRASTSQPAGEMESKAQLLVVAVTWFLLLAIVAAGVVPAGAGAVKALLNESKAATSSSSWTWPTVAPELEDTVEALPAAGVHHEVHRRVLAKDPYLNPSLQANRQRCINGCPGRGGPFTGRGDKCIYHNGGCR